MHKTKTRDKSFLLIFVIYIEVVKTNTSFLSTFFLAKNILQNNSFFDYNFNM